MRTTNPARRLTRWGISLAATGLLSLGGVWVSAQDADSAAQDPVPAAARAASPTTVAADPAGVLPPPAPPDREHVPTVAELQAQLTGLRRDTLTSVGGPALEHAALALGRARQAEGERDAGSAGAANDALRARRIAHAALTLVVAQREREQARLLRDEAAQARQAADGAARTAEEALRVARANAAAVASAPATATTAPAAPPAVTAPAGSTTAEPAGPSTTEETP
jgi:hypothetical protein